MKTRKNPLSIRIIYWLTQISFWLFVLVFFASIAFNIALQFEVLGNDLQIHTKLPVKTSYTEKGTLSLYEAVYEVEFVEAQGKIHFINTDPRLAKWFGGLLLGVVGISLYIFLKFKQFIYNVYRGYIFERFNIRMLQNMAFGLVALWGFMILYCRLYYYLIAKNLSFPHLIISDEMDNYAFILIIALLLWMLSHIFMHGVKLQDEQDLTV